VLSVVLRATTVRRESNERFGVFQGPGEGVNSKTVTYGNDGSIRIVFSSVILLIPDVSLYNIITSLYFVLFQKPNLLRPNTLSGTGRQPVLKLGLLHFRGTSLAGNKNVPVSYLRMPLNPESVIAI
jgi:hypothetical protein